MPMGCASGCSPMRRTGRSAPTRPGMPSAAPCASRPNGTSSPPWTSTRSPRPTPHLKLFRVRSTSTTGLRDGAAAPAPSSCAATCPATHCCCRCPRPRRISASDRTACCTGRSPIGCTSTTCGAAGQTRWYGSRDLLPGGSRLTAAGCGDRTAGRLARLTGVPMPFTTPARDDYAPGVFRPDPENCCPPAMRLLDAVSWPVGERPIALAAHPESRPCHAVVVWRR